MERSRFIRHCRHADTGFLAIKGGGEEGGEEARTGCCRVCMLVWSAAADISSCTEVRPQTEAPSSRLSFHVALATRPHH